MWNYPEFDPVALSLGPVQIHWYALSYLIGIAGIWWHLSYRAKGSPGSRGTAQLRWSDEQVSDLVFYAVFGVILGGRIGYILIYGRQGLIDDPLSAFKVWQGGMSFHGGMVGVFVAMYIYGRQGGRTFFQVTDFIAPSIPIALCTGRLGNFINGELPGRPADVPWALVFPGEDFGRHPSSLYQSVLEGPVLFILLWLFLLRPKPGMAISGMFLLGYGSLRFTSEIFRRPDLHMGEQGYIAFGWLTTGQLLSFPMIIFGVVFLVYSYVFLAKSLASNS